MVAQNLKLIHASCTVPASPASARGRRSARRYLSSTTDGPKRAPRARRLPKQPPGSWAGNVCQPLSWPTQLGICNVAPRVPHRRQRVRWRIMSLEASWPHRIMQGTNAIGGAGSSHRKPTPKAVDPIPEMIGRGERRATVLARSRRSPTSGGLRVRSAARAARTGRHRFRRHGPRPKLHAIETTRARGGARSESRCHRARKSSRQADRLSC